MTAADPPRAPAPPGCSEAPVRVAVDVRGAVQGVGFRPFVHRLAREGGLAGFVTNDLQGVHLEVEGPAAAVDGFLAALRAAPPPRAVLREVRVTPAPPRGERGFEIRASGVTGAPTATVLADGATCAACLAEVLDPADRRHRYPFGSCTHCGPRYAIVTSLPWDRAGTTMARFPLCPACRAEHDDPTDRRFHAVPVACPACGPQAALLAPDGAVLARRDDAVSGAVAALRAGRVVAVLGVGGFQLLVDATDDAAVARLRARKAREEKPLALLVADVAAAEALVDLGPAARAALTAPEGPIVLAPRRAGATVAAAVAPGVARLGVLLPTTPLHHLLARGVGRPVVATSGNRSDEPLATTPEEGLVRLAGLADLFLVHDRPVARPLDDSVVAVAADGAFPVRRARGWAPMPVARRRPGPAVLALGGHLKVAVALGLEDQVLLGPHVGDLDGPEALDAFLASVRDLLALHAVRPAALAHDAHPDYATTRFAEDLATAAAPWARALAGLPRVVVGHHHAHHAAVLAEHGVEGPVLGASFDGAGLGPDGTVWGGEVLLGDARGVERVATLSGFRLPGGDAAARAPWRSAAGLLVATRGPGALDHPALASRPAAERARVATMLARGVASPPTTSVGRLFDAVAALLGGRHVASYEGQAAAELEALAAPGDHGTWGLRYAAPPGGGPGPAVLPLDRLVDALEADRRAGVPGAIIAARFHDTLSEALVELARARAAPRLALSGGCWLNVRLRDGVHARAAAVGIEVLAPRSAPPGDGGLSLGQVAVADARGAGRA